MAIHGSFLMLFDLTPNDSHNRHPLDFCQDGCVVVPLENSNIGHGRPVVGGPALPLDWLRNKGVNQYGATFFTKRSTTRFFTSRHFGDVRGRRHDVLCRTSLGKPRHTDMPAMWTYRQPLLSKPTQAMEMQKLRALF